MPKMIPDTNASVDGRCMSLLAITGVAKGLPKIEACEGTLQ